MNRNTMISVILWTLIAGALIFFFNAYPKAFALPGIVLLVPAVAIIAYYVGWRGKRGQKAHDLVLGRFAPKTLMMAGAALFVLAIAWIVFVARAVQSDADKVLFVVIVPVLAMIALGSILVSVGLYYTIKRN